MSSHAINETGVAALRRAQAALKLVKPEPGDLAHYSLPRALRYALMEGQGEWGFEALCSEEFERAGYVRRMRRSVFVPPAVLLRNLDRTGLRAAQPYESGTVGSGAELVQTEFRGDLFIDALRPRSIALQLGAQSVGELVGNVEIPRMDTTSIGCWQSNPSSAPVSITESEGTFDSSPIVYEPCTVGGYSTVSRLLLQQSRLAELVIANDLMRSIGTALDAAVFQGSGSGGTPTGVTNTSGVNAVAGASFSLSTSITAAQTVATANAIISRRALGWAVTPAIAALLIGRMKILDTFSPIWSNGSGDTGGLDSGIINDHPALSSTNVPGATAIFADWSQVLILTWGPNAPLEVEVNPYANFANGDVAVRALLSANVVVRHPASFSVVSSIT